MKMKIKSMLFRFNCNKKTHNVKFVISWHEKKRNNLLVGKRFKFHQIVFKYRLSSSHTFFSCFILMVLQKKILFCQITKKNSKLAIWYMRVSYFKVISLFMYQLSMAVNEICRYDVSVGSKFRNAQEMFSNIQRWREQKHTHIDHL